MLDNSKAILDSVNNIKNQIIDTKTKLDNSKKLSIISFISSGIFFIIFIVLISLFFTINSSKLILAFSIITLIIAFLLLQVGVVSLLLIRYLYKEKLNALLKASELIKREINK